LLSKTISKKLICGTCINKKEDGSCEVEVQGDGRKNIFTLLTKTFNISENLIYTFENSNRKILLKDLK
jgi:translation initiation factor 1 (eIF-1/SUI1)